MEGKPYARRLLELEQRFGELEPGIPDSSENEALSVLHGMVQELSRTLRSVASPPSTNALTLDDIIDLHRIAPPMEGSARVGAAGHRNAGARLHAAGRRSDLSGSVRAACVSDNLRQQNNHYYPNCP